jgi:hypothetical protein
MRFLVNNLRLAMKKLCDLYIARAGFIGALYCIVPTLIGFAILFCVHPFREVYLVRLAIAILVGGPAAAYLNRFGLSLWLIKHASPKGPATTRDGVLIGSFLGMGMAVIPALIHCIASSNLDQTKTVIISIWLFGAIGGAIIGGILGLVGGKNLDRRSGT